MPIYFPLICIKYHNLFFILILHFICYGDTTNKRLDYFFLKIPIWIYRTPAYKNLSSLYFSIIIYSASNLLPTRDIPWQFYFRVIYIPYWNKTVLSQLYSVINLIQTIGENGGLLSGNVFSFLISASHIESTIYDRSKCGNKGWNVHKTYKNSWIFSILFIERSCSPISFYSLLHFLWHWPKMHR
jgi:hypothetical protein